MKITKKENQKKVVYNFAIISYQKKTKKGDFEATNDSVGVYTNRELRGVLCCCRVD